jgi:hypothetical protein
MVWVISVAVFLATVVAALLIFLIVSQKEQIKKALKEKRNERRIPVKVELEISPPREPPIYEDSATEDASSHGARIISSTRWQPHEHVLVRLPSKNEPSRARVIYCDALPTNTFAVGLRFSSAVDDWLMPDDDVASDERPYRK